MSKVTARVYAAAVLALSALLLLAAADTSPVSPTLAQHRNLGRAFYENPTTQAEAVWSSRRLSIWREFRAGKAELRAALLRAGRVQEGVAQLKDVQRRDPKLPPPGSTSAFSIKKTGDTNAAVAQFERMIQIVPNEAIGHYQSGPCTSSKTAPARRWRSSSWRRSSIRNWLRRSPALQFLSPGRARRRAARALAEFQRIKKQAKRGHSRGCGLVRLCRDIRSARAPRGKRRRCGPRLRPSTRIACWKARRLGCWRSIHGEGRTDLLAWSAGGVALYVRANWWPMRDSRPERRHLGGGGDFNNDGFMDLCVLAESGRCAGHSRGISAASNQFAPAAIRARRMDRLRSRLRSRPDLLGASPALMRNEGRGGVSRIGPRISRSSKASRPRRRNCACARQQSVRPRPFLSRPRPVCIATAWAAITRRSRSQGTPPDDSRVEADFDNEAGWIAPALRRRQDSPPPTAAAARALDPVHLQGIRISKAGTGRGVESSRDALPRAFMPVCRLLFSRARGFGGRGAHHLAQRADSETKPGSGGAGLYLSGGARLSGSCP